MKETAPAEYTVMHSSHGNNNYNGNRTPVAMPIPKKKLNLTPEGIAEARAWANEIRATLGNYQ